MMFSIPRRATPPLLGPRVAPVGGGDGLPLLGFILGEVLPGQDAADGLDVVHHLLGEVAVVEGFLAPVGDEIQGVGQVLVVDGLAVGVGEPVVGVQAQGIGIRGQVLVPALDVGVPALGQGEAVAGQVDDRLQDLTAGQVAAAVLLQGRHGAVDHPGDGQGFHGGRVGGGVGGDLSGDGRSGRLGHVLQHQVPVLRLQVDDHLAGAAHAGSGGLQQAHGVDHGHGRVHGVAAGLEDVHADLGRDGVGAGSRAELAHGAGAVVVTGVCAFEGGLRGGRDLRGGRRGGGFGRRSGGFGGLGLGFDGLGLLAPGHDAQQHHEGKTKCDGFFHSVSLPMVWFSRKIQRW